MRCINFDKEFERYVTAWMKEHAKEYKNYDAMEAAMPQVYDEFLDTPVNWLSGCKPGEYFQQFDNPRQLVNWMEDYFKQRIPVPDMLMNRITELGLAAEESLLNMMQKEKATQEIKMAAVTLLREIESCAAMQRYIDWQAVRVAGQEDELADEELRITERRTDRLAQIKGECFASLDDDALDFLLLLWSERPLFTELPTSRLLLDAAHTLLLVCTYDATCALVGNVQQVSDFRFLFALGMQADRLLLDGIVGKVEMHRCAVGGAGGDQRHLLLRLPQPIVGHFSNAVAIDNRIVIQHGEHIPKGPPQHPRFQRVDAAIFHNVLIDLGAGQIDRQRAVLEFI